MHMNSLNLLIKQHLYMDLKGYGLTQQLLGLGANGLIRSESLRENQCRNCQLIVSTSYTAYWTYVCSRFHVIT